MNAERLLAHFKTISEAPDAVARLRRFILDLAVRGKLVEQDPEDEPAEELFCRYLERRMDLASQAKIRRPKPSSPIRDDETPIALPCGWTWARLNEIGNLSGGMTPSMGRPDFWNGEITWLSPKDIKSDEVFESELRLSELGLSESRLELYPPSCLFIVARSGILKRTLPVAINRVSAAANQDMKVLVPYVGDQERYLQIMLKGLTDFILKSLVKAGTTVQSLKYGEFAEQPFPIPPLAEQHRIVAKVDELMALCDQLEAARQEREKSRDRLVTSTLQRLNQPAEHPTTFRSDVSFALQVLPAITTTPAQIKQLRQTILNLAVRGKLVEQDPEDEPAEEQLERITLQKLSLARKERAFKKRKSDVSIESFQHHLPAGWVTATLADLVTILNGRAYKQSELLESGTPVLRVGNLFTSNKWYYSNLELEDDKYCDDGDLIFAWSASFGPFIWKGGRVIYHYHIWKLPLHSPGDLSRDYLHLYLLHKTAEIKSAGHGISMTHMTKEKMEHLEVPLPPLAEQHRIVAKVDELMALCDQLEQQLSQADQDRRSLLETLLFEALNRPAVVKT